MSVFPKLISRFNTIAIKIPVDIFKDTDNLIQRERRVGS